MKEELWLWLWIPCWSALHPRPSGADLVSLPEITDTQFISDCVERHNRARSLVEPPASDMLHMTWDTALAVTARAWAQHCDFSHNIHLGDPGKMHPVFQSVGENIWVGTPPSSFSVSGAVDSWVNERTSYNYSSNVCTSICGHYKQVVWASTYKLGCAVQLCPDGVKGTSYGDGGLFVCNYAVGGNVDDGRPYHQGTPCSTCEAQCAERLCGDQEEDAQNGYNWIPDWDPGLSSCGPSCVHVLVLRPLTLISIFVAAYGVSRIYPDIYCYQ